MPRIQVVRTLAAARTPLSAYGIHDEILASGGRIDVVSVYRILDTLSSLGLIHHIGIVDGYKACSLGETHHDDSEHIVCESCGSIVEVEVPGSTREATYGQLQGLGFVPKNIKLEILAICASCQPT